MKKEVKLKKPKKEKVKMSYPKGQFWFNVISLVLLICLALFIGGRSIYYYSLQHAKEKKEASTLSTIIKKDHPVVESGDGLYKINQEYIFKGKDISNYIEYSNRLWRIVKINEDNSVQLVTDSVQNVLIWGDEVSYQNSNLYRWLNKQENIEHTGIFFDSLNKPAVYLDTTPWCEGKIENNKLNCEKKNKNDSVALLTTMDYMNARGKDSYLNDGSYSWLLGLDNEDDNIYLNKTGNISPATIDSGYGVKPVITIKNNIDVLEGNGTKESPYKIEPSDQLSYVNRFVKLGNDLYRVQEEKDQRLKLSLNQYLQVSKKDYESSYSDSTTEFSITDRKNIGYYLNHTYLSSLSYQDKLSECTFYIGEASEEVGYNYLNSYQKELTAKVGMLMMTDLKLHPDLTDYYLMQTTSSLGEMALVHDITGGLKEVITKEKKKIVPVVCMTKDKIIEGMGTMDSPYITE